MEKGDRIEVSNKKFRLDGTVEIITEKAIKIVGTDSFGIWGHGDS